MVEQLAVIGGSGYVGSTIVEQLSYSGENIAVLAPTHSEADITKKERVREWILTNRPNTVVLSAAWTDVDGAEQVGNQPKVAKTNISGVVNIANAVKEIKGYLVFISSDYVFSGLDEEGEIGPYSEDRKPSSKIVDGSNHKARGFYGETKSSGEIVLANMHVNHAIVRIASPFGNIANPSKDYALKMLKAAKKYPIFIDQFITPTYLPDLSSAIKVLAGSQRRGVYHVATCGLTTPYAFVRRLYQSLGLPVDGVKMGSFKSYGAPRPQYGGLLCDKTQEELGIKFHSWQEAVDIYSGEIKRFIPREELLK